MASLITGVLIVFSTVCSGADRRKTSKLRVTGLCEGNSPVTGEFPAVTDEFPAQKPVTRKMFPFDGVILKTGNIDVDECSSMKCEVSAHPPTLHSSFQVSAPIVGTHHRHLKTAVIIQISFSQCINISLVKI